MKLKTKRKKRLSVSVIKLRTQVLALQAEIITLKKQRNEWIKKHDELVAVHN